MIYLICGAVRLKAHRLVPYPGAVRPVFFYLAIRFQISDIQVNKAFFIPYFEDNPAALKFVVI